MLRGDRTKVSSSLAAFGVTSSVSFDRIANRLFDRATSKAKIDFEGVDLALYSEDIARFSLITPGEWISRSETNGLSVDISPSELPFLPASPLVPQLLSLNIESGHAVTPGTPASPTASYQVLSEWKTAFGSTTLLYWNEMQGHAGVARGYQRDASEIVDINHSFRLARWRFSLGASATDFASSDPENGFADTALSGRFSIRYAVENGPQFEAALGQTHNEFDLLFDDFRQSSQATRLTLSLDLSDYVQRRLDRRDTRLTFDFRHDLSEAQYEVNWGLPPDAVRRNTTTGLISFSTPL